jgi:hypothetical protein
MDGFTKIFIILLSLLFIGFLIMIIGIIKLSLKSNLNYNKPIPTPIPILPPVYIWTDDKINNAQKILNNFFKIFVPDKNILIDNDCFKDFISNYKGSFEDFSNIFKDVNNNNIPTDDNIKLIISTINSFVILCEQKLEWNNGITDSDLKNLLPSILLDDSKFNCIKTEITKKYTYFSFSFLIHLSYISTIKYNSIDDLPSTLKDFVNFIQNICN